MFVVFSNIALKSTRSSPLATILPKILFPPTAKTTAENRRQFSSPASNMEKPNTIYQFHALDIDGNDVNLDKYRGKVVMIMNVASECGYTKVNYGQGRELLEKYKDQGFCIAAFPCNQFNNEEPGTNEQIKEFINGKWNFYPDLYAKINVNGKEAHPLWNFLKEEQHGTIIDAIKWNFTKFLVNKEGQVIARYAPNVEPKQIEPDIRKCLGIGER